MNVPRWLILMALLAAVWSMGMALDCTRADDDDDFSSDYEYDDDDWPDDDDDTADDDAGDDDSGDDDSGDDDTGDDDSEPQPEGFLTGAWSINGNTFCWIGGTFGFGNGIDGEIEVEHWEDDDILLFDNGPVGWGYLDGRDLELEFEHAWGFEYPVHEDPDEHSMTMSLSQRNENRFVGTVEYETIYYLPWISYVCTGYVRMDRIR